MKISQFNTIPDPENMIGNVKELCQKLGNLTIVLKGAYDIISNGKEGEHIHIFLVILMTVSILIHW